jgi:hypothetical protein
MPWQTTPSQEEMLRRNATQHSVSEKFRIGLCLSYLASRLETDNRFLVSVANARYVHTEELFFGNANAARTLAYMDDDSRVERPEEGKGLFYGLERIEPGDSVAFKSTFEDDEVTFLWPRRARDRRLDIRFGFYASEWEKPSALSRAWTLDEDGALVVFEGDYETRGVVGIIETVDTEAAGLQGAAAVRWGLDNEIRNALYREYYYEDEDDLLYGAATLDIWYNWHPLKDEAWGVFVTVGGRYDRRMFATEISLDSGGVDFDQLFALYGRVGVNW